ncbi:MAG TPA: heavy metal-binding domain-containing protein [Gemmatimonadales bacterium]|nr:heavy metal-binding domain-containing protein [Gemmatimonadales bacterium]
MPEPTTYTCPMHPEVKQQTPGKCPKCGMDLTPAGTGAAGTEQHEPPYTKSGGIVAPKFGSAGSGGAEYEPGPESDG